MSANRNVGGKRYFLNRARDHEIDLTVAAVGGRMNPLRIFIVLSWVAFALRQIMLKPARAVAGLGGEASGRAPPGR